jgi:SAM-dependent methyltransferase
MITYFNTQYLQYILLQRTRLFTEYAITENSSQQEIVSALNKMTKRDFEMLEPFLACDTLTKCNILDIGCGLGTIDIFISKKYPNSKIIFQDKTDNIDTTRKYNGFNETYHYYNNLDLLNDFLKQHDIQNYQIVDGENIYKINEKFDYIISLLSCGWHYTLNTYLEFIKHHLTSDGKLIIDVRSDTDEHLLYENFHNVFRIFNENEKRHDGGIVGYRYICSKVK